MKKQNLSNRQKNTYAVRKSQEENITCQKQMFGINEDFTESSTCWLNNA